MLIISLFLTSISFACSSTPPKDSGYQLEFSATYKNPHTNQLMGTGIGGYWFKTLDECLIAAEAKYNESSVPRKDGFELKQIRTSCLDQSNGEDYLYAEESLD